MLRLPNLCLALACGVATVAVSSSAWASELKILAAPAETDGAGKLTGSPKTIKELASLPGEETWEFHMWAKLDKGAPGPLYAEFYGDLNGKRYLAQRFEKSDYNGEKYISWSIELDGNLGFNRKRTYKVELSQLGQKDKSIKLASSSIKLLFTEDEPEESEEESGGDEEEVEDDGADLGDDEQDAHDSLGDGPPPVAPPAKKKGCSVQSEPFSGPAILLMVGLGALIRRRRED